MPTDTSVPHKGPQTQPKIDDHLADAGTDFVSLANSLTPDQVRILTQLVTPLDRATTPLRIGFFATRQTDRAAILEHLVRPAATRKVRTPEHRKVVGLRIDAATVPEGMLPWHYLVFNVIELLGESALLSERSALSELRNEISRLIRMYRRDPAVAEQPAVAFAKRFQTQFPKLVTNTISLSNSVLLIVLDRVDDSAPQDAIQWLEASQYFCNAPGCAVLLSVNEPAMAAKLNLGANSANGRDILGKWVTKRIDYSTQAATIENPGTGAPGVPAADRTESRAAPARDTTPKGGAQSRLHQTDVPTASASIIRDALQPDMNAIVRATSQWRVTMQAVLRRTDEGVPGVITATLIAKLVALRAVAPSLFETARYDAAALIGLERAAHGDTSSPANTEWGEQVGKHPRLLGIFKAEPEFSSIDTRELATAMRLTNSSDEVALREAAAEEEPLQIRKNRPNRGESSPARAQGLQAASENVETHFLLSQAFIATAGTGVAIFLIDRVSKLLIQALVNPLAGGWISPEVMPASAVAGGVLSVGLATGVEFFGLVLAILIAVFWGSLRRQTMHLVSLGLIIGALASNLFDRIAYGNVLTYAHIANLPGFNLAHIALLAGALLLGITIARNALTPKTATND